jgi:hypothetical protein
MYETQGRYMWLEMYSTHLVRGEAVLLEQSSAARDLELVAMWYVVLVHASGNSGAVPILEKSYG